MEQIIIDRRALHRIPELDRDLDRTMAYLRGALQGLRCRLFSPIPNSLCAFFDNESDSAIAFRCGCDGLPVHERSFLPFSSEIPGQMHACGHDGHMAMLLELARRMQDARIGRNVLLIFQPAEETTGGARDICKSGVFEKNKVEAVFGMHLWPDLPLGTIASRERAMMSRSCEVSVRFAGRSCSAARRDEGVDALRAAVEFYHRATELAAAGPSEPPRLLHFGHMESPGPCNVVSDAARLEGTLRAFDDETFLGILDGLEQLASKINAETGCKIDIETSMGYPALVNPPELCARVRSAGVHFTELAQPAMITEDFSWYQRHLPGMYFLLGIGPCPALQAEDFNFDESVLMTGADFLEDLARRYAAT